MSKSVGTRGADTEDRLSALTSMAWMEPADPLFRVMSPCAHKFNRGLADGIMAKPFCVRSPPDMATALTWEGAAV